jgi:hypothetical protein
MKYHCDTHKRIASMSRQLRRSLAASVTALLLLAGCAPIALDPAPFEEYRDAFRDMRTSAERVMRADYEWTYRAFVETTAGVDGGLLPVIVLEFPDGDYVWTLPDEPLVGKVRQTRNYLAGLNTAFADSTDLLTRLAGGAVTDTTAFASEVFGLNRSSRTAIERLDVPDRDGTGVLFSPDATAAAKSYIVTRAPGDLASVVRQNQDDVDGFTGVCVDALRMTAADIKATYHDDLDRILGDYDVASPEERKALAWRLMSLNERVIAHLNILETLDIGYQTLARTHGELERSLRIGQGLDLSDLTRVTDQLDGQYEALQR